MKRSKIFCAIISIFTSSLKTADINKSDTDFINQLEQFIKNKKKSVLAHIKKGRLSLRECHALLESGTTKSADNGFYYLETISGSNEIKTRLSPSFHTTYCTLLGFDDNADLSEKKKNAKEFDFYYGFPQDNCSDFEQLFLHRVFCQFKGSYRSFEKQKYSQVHEDKIQKIKSATQLVLASLKYDYETIGKQKRFSQQVPRPRKEEPSLSQSKSF